PSSPAAASNGIRAASRVSPSASVGLSPPGSSPSSSSRGEKARPAGRAGRVAPPQPQRGALPRGQDLARVPPPSLQRPAALRAPRPLPARGRAALRRRASLGQVLQEARLQPPH